MGRATLLPVLIVYLATVRMAIASDDDVLKEIIAGIRAGQERYQAVDFLVRESYLFNGYRNQLAGESGELVRNRERTTRIVYQGAQFLVDQVDRAVIVDGEMRESSMRVGYDGTTTRLLKNAQLANITDQAYYGPGLLRPHTLLLQDIDVFEPLSVFLTAGNVRGGNVSMQVRVDGQEAVDGQRCIRLRCERYSLKPRKAKTPNVLVLWVAPERNYLPLRMEFIKPSHNPKLAKTSASVTRCEEVTLGVWFPMEAAVQIFDETELWQNRATVLASRGYRVELVTLSPNHDIEAFRNVDVPPGARVFELQDGRIREYVADDGPGQTRESWVHLGWLVVVPVIVLSAVIVWMWSRRGRLRSRHG